MDSWIVLDTDKLQPCILLFHFTLELFSVVLAKHTYNTLYNELTEYYVQLFNNLQNILSKGPVLI